MVRTLNSTNTGRIVTSDGFNVIQTSDLKSEFRKLEQNEIDAAHERK